MPETTDMNNGPGDPGASGAPAAGPNSVGPNEPTGGPPSAEPVAQPTTGANATYSYADVCHVEGCWFIRHVAYSGMLPCLQPWSGDPKAQEDRLRGCLRSKVRP